MPAAAQRSPRAYRGSIYSIHRGDFTGASAKLEESKLVAKRDLLPVVASHPTLRYGAVASAMEEYAEVGADTNTRNVCSITRCFAELAARRGAARRPPSLRSL
jgi:hypothetical protein